MSVLAATVEHQAAANGVKEKQLPNGGIGMKERLSGFDFEKMREFQFGTERGAQRHARFIALLSSLYRVANRPILLMVIAIL